MRFSPHSLYIRYLVTTGLTDNKKINKKLQDMGLKPVDNNVINEQQLYIMNLLPETITKKFHSRSKAKIKDWMKWMKILGVHDMWYSHQPFCEFNTTKANSCSRALDILNDNKLQVSLNGLLIKRMEISTLTQTMNIRFQMDLTDLILKIYRDYFFNPLHMRRDDWKTHLSHCGNFEQHIYFTALTENLDAVKFELGLPANVSVTEELGFLLKKSLQKSKQYLRSNTISGGAEARRWIGVSLSLADKYEKYRDTDTTDFGNALQMELIEDNVGFAQADQILGQVDADPEEDSDDQLPLNGVD